MFYQFINVTHFNKKIIKCAKHGKVILRVLVFLHININSNRTIHLNPNGSVRQTLNMI